MYFIRKLRPPKMGKEWLPVIIALPAIAIIMIYWGIRGAWAAIAIIEIPVVLMHLNSYFRTRNKFFLVLAGAFLLIVLSAVYIFIYGIDKNDPGQISFTIALIFAIFVIGYILFNKKIKWRTREILELAAMPVIETREGFSERPFPIAKIDATEQEIDAFTMFISRNLIAMPYQETGRTIYSLSSSYWKQNGLKRGYEEESWVSFSKEGEVSVFISQNDYLKYRETYSFDQLCSSLGNLFIEFFVLFRRGEGLRIMDKLDALRLNPITE